MIVYRLACEHGHDFESWFASSAAYDAQKRRGLVTCPICGSAKVDKAIMAPAVARKDKGRSKHEVPAPQEAPQQEMPQQPVAVFDPREKELRNLVRALRQHVKENSDYVGRRFSDEARQMHEGAIEHRSIWGEASAEEAKALIDDGIEVQPLPTLPDEHN